MSELPKHIINARDQTDINSVYLEWLKFKKPIPANRPYLYTSAFWGLTLVLTLLGLSVSEYVAFHTMTLVAVLIISIDFLGFLPNVIKRDRESGMLALMASTPLSNREIIEGLWRWIVPLNLWHISLFLLLVILLPVFSGAYGILTGSLVLLVMGAAWYMLLGCGVVASFQYGSIFTEYMVAFAGFIVTGTTYVTAMFITNALWDKMVFVNLFDNAEEIRAAWLIFWFLLLAPASAGSWWVVDKTVQTWRSSISV